MQPSLGINHYYNSDRNLDELTPDMGGWDYGSRGWTNIPDPICNNHDDGFITLQEAFDQWCDYTAVAEFGGAPYGCAGGFPCNQWRTVTVPDLQLDYASPQALCGFDQYGYPPGPWTVMTVGPARLQWFWLCARLVSSGGMYFGPLYTATGFEVIVEDTLTNEVLLHSHFLVTTSHDTPDACGVVCGRCRQIWPTHGLRISFRRESSACYEVADEEATQTLEVTVLGRVGYAGA